MNLGTVPFHYLGWLRSLEKVEIILPRTLASLPASHNNQATISIPLLPTFKAMFQHQLVLQSSPESSLQNVTTPSTAILTLFPVLLSAASADFNNILRFAVDRPLLRIAIALVLTRPLPMWRPPPASTENIEITSKEEEGKTGESALISFLAQRNSRANRQVCESVAIQLRQRGYQAKTLGWRSLFGVLLLYVIALLVAICVTVAHSAAEDIVRNSLLVACVLGLQAATGMFGVYDREVVDSSGAQEAHLGRLCRKFERDCAMISPAEDVESGVLSADEETSESGSLYTERRQNGNDTPQGDLSARHENSRGCVAFCTADWSEREESTSQLALCSLQACCIGLCCLAPCLVLVLPCKILEYFFYGLQAGFNFLLRPFVGLRTTVKKAFKYIIVRVYLHRFRTFGKRDNLIVTPRKVKGFSFAVPVTIGSVQTVVEIPLKRFQSLEMPTSGLFQQSKTQETLQVWQKKYVLSFKTGKRKFEYIRWLRIEWICVVGQLYLLNLLSYKADLTVLLVVGCVQILPAFLGAMLIYVDVMGTSNAEDRILATTRLNDPVYPHIAYTLSDRFVELAWNSVADVYELWHQNLCDNSECRPRRSAIEISRSRTSSMTSGLEAAALEEAGKAAEASTSMAASVSTLGNPQNINDVLIRWRSIFQMAFKDRRQDEHLNDSEARNLSQSGVGLKSTKAEVNHLFTKEELRIAPYFERWFEQFANADLCPRCKRHTSPKQDVPDPHSSVGIVLHPVSQAAVGKKRSDLRAYPSSIFKTIQEESTSVNTQEQTAGNGDKVDDSLKTAVDEVSEGSTASEHGGKGKSKM